MLIVMKTGSGPEDLARVEHVVEGLGYRARAIRLTDQVSVVVSGYETLPTASLFESLPGVCQVLPGSRPLRHAIRSEETGPTQIRVGRTTVGQGHLTLIGGPCAVESEDELVALAHQLRRGGADLLRGGAYKPRTSPYDFQGVGETGLSWLARAREEAGIPVVTEAIDSASFDLVERHADVIQIGARNMQNYALLRRAGESDKPILLKRGPSADLDEWLAAAEYILAAGNERVILCERGIRTFSRHSRYTLDLAVVPRLKRLTHLPVIVDPSHACGTRSSVIPLSLASAAAGADGVMVEVHADPAHALCDGPQSLLPDEFNRLASDLRALVPFLARQREMAPEC